MIKINYKNEIEEYLKKELELCTKILSYNEQIEKYTKNGENKKADEVLKKSIEKTKELGLIDGKIKKILVENNIEFEVIREEFKGIVSEISEVISKITELYDKAKVLINKEKDSVLKELKKLRTGISGYGKLTSDGDKNFIDLIE